MYCGYKRNWAAAYPISLPYQSKPLVSNLSATRVTTLVKNNQLVFAVYIASSIEISSVYDDRHIPVFM